MNSPPNENVQRKTVLELALAKEYEGAEEAETRRIRSHIDEVVKQAEDNDEDVPCAIVFCESENAIPSGEGVRAAVVDEHDEITITSTDCKLGGLDGWAKQRTLEDRVRLIFVRSRAGQAFVLNGERYEVSEKKDPCVFSPGTFYELDKALNEYEEEIARYSNCGHLVQAWQDRGEYILVAGPEKKLRDSLWSFLRIRLRDHQVDREFTVGATHPVDVVVTWTRSARIALIEVKWMGQATTSTRQGPADAEGGAEQLRDKYLEPYIQEHDDQRPRGYLATFDCRKNARKFPGFCDELENDDRLHLEYIFDTNPA